MYLPDLYKRSKCWFIAILGFIICQLFINYKQGVVVSPFYHYGMYSEVFLPKKEYIVPEIRVNGALLKTKDFNPQFWDKIIQPLILFDSTDNWNRKIYFNEIEPLNIKDSALYLNQLSYTAFMDWYKAYLESLLKKKIVDLSIKFSKARFDGNKMIVEN